MRRALLSFALVLAASPAARPQSVISLRAGLLNYAEGRLETTDPAAKTPRSGAYHLRAGEQLLTRRGRAEILLAPCVFLRLADNSRVAMENDSLDGAEVALLDGTAVIDAVDIPKDNRVRIRVGDSVTELNHAGVYRFDAVTGEIRVFDGKADVARGGSHVVLKKGKLLAVNTAGSAPADFDRKSIDRIQRWAARRSLAVAQSNLVSARASYGHSWRRVARIWIWSLYINSEAARASLAPPPAPVPSGF